jgi:hypothetical protein
MLLRSLVILIGVACLAGGLVANATGAWQGGWVAMFWGALLLVGTVWERVRYKPLDGARPGPGWVATPERFIDDETGKPVRVWLEPASGERRYVTE